LKVDLVAFIVLSLLACTLRAGTPAEKPEPLQAGKILLLARLETHILESQKQIDELRALIGKSGKAASPAWNNHPPEFSVDAPHRLEQAVARQKRQRAMLALIKKEDAGRVPTLLETLFLPCDRRVCQNLVPYWEVEDSIAAFGALALQPLLVHFQTLDTQRKESILRLVLQIEPGQCPTAVLDDALTETWLPVRLLSLNVYKHNCAADVFIRRLERLFLAETDPEFLLHLLNQMPNESWKMPRLHNRLIQLAQEQRIPLYRAFEKLCNMPADAITLNADALDISFWLQAFEAATSRRSCLIGHLFLHLDQEKQLNPLHSLFREAADHRYRFNSISTLSGFTTPSPYAYWDMLHGADQRFLTLLQTHLSNNTLNAWRHAPDATWGEILLLSQWLGEDTASLFPKRLRLRLEVRNPANKVVSDGTEEVTLGQPFDFTLSPRGADFQTIRYEGVLSFNPGTLNYTIKDFLVELNPAGVMFDISVPATGHFETDLIQQQKKFRWKISLLP